MEIVYENQDFIQRVVLFVFRALMVESGWTESLLEGLTKN